MGNLQGKEYESFEGKHSSTEKRDKVRYLVASWISYLPQFEDFPIYAVVSKWRTIAFPSTVVHQIRPIWSRPPGRFMLNFDGSALENLRIGGII